jgi:hypothetical protein
MTTKLVIPITPEDTEGMRSKAFFVQESYDEAIEKIHPLQPAASSLEHRQQLQWRLTDGRRVLIQPGSIAWVEEDPETDDVGY